MQALAIPLSQQPISAMQQPLPLISAIQQSFSAMAVKAAQLAEQPTSPLLPVKSEPQPGSSRNTRPLFASIYHQATIHIWNEAQRSTTDALPTPGNNGRKVIESILVPLPARPVTRNLWTYSEKMPVVSARKTDNAGAEKVVEAKGAGNEPLNFLL